MVFAEKLNFESSIERKLTLQNVVILSLSAMVGSGLFVLPALAGKELYYGSGNMSGIYAMTWLAYLVSALVVLPGALSKSELSTAMPLSGGAYLYIERTFGPLLGTMAGLGLWASFFLKSAFALVGFSAYLIATEGLLGWEISTLTSKLVATGLLVVITGINIRGLGLLKKVQTPILFIAVGCVLLLVGWAFLNGTVDRPTAPIDAAGEAVTSLSGWQGIAASAAHTCSSRMRESPRSRPLRVRSRIPRGTYHSASSCHWSSLAACIRSLPSPCSGPWRPQRSASVSRVPR